jgi:hypothetical protein
MTAQEKWDATMYYMNLVGENYTRIKKGETYRITHGKDRQEVQNIRRWCRVIEGVYRTLRFRTGKSAARAQRDWLIARRIEMMMLGSGMQAGKMKSGRHTLNQRYVDELTREAVLAVQKAAQAEGLLGKAV